jgi:hypothetical protein
MAVDERKFLALSRALNDLPLGDQKFSFHAVRYKFFYDNSPRKHNCTYARLTRQYFENEKEIEVLRPILLSIPNAEYALKILGEL